MMEFTADADFNDIFWEPPETEFQPLLDFENEVLSEVPHNDISLLTQRIKRNFLDYVLHAASCLTLCVATAYINGNTETSPNTANSL
jgi:hypothetical protein